MSFRRPRYLATEALGCLSKSGGGKEFCVLIVEGYIEKYFHSVLLSQNLPSLCGLTELH
jgi:hypothetical protein